MNNNDIKTMPKDHSEDNVVKGSTVIEDNLKEDVNSENKDTNSESSPQSGLFRLAGFALGAPVGIITGYFIGYLILMFNKQPPGHFGLGLLVIYMIIGSAGISAIIGACKPKFMVNAFVKIFSVLSIVLLISFVVFKVSTFGFKNIDSGKFNIAGDESITSKLAVNVRYFISDEEQPLYTIFFQGRDRYNGYSHLPDYQYINNLDAEKYEFFINYNNQLFDTFLTEDLERCKESSANSSQDGFIDLCWNKDFLHFIQVDDAVYYNCKTLNDIHCKKLEPLSQLTGVPSVFLLGHPIGLAKADSYREKRSFKAFLLRVLSI